MVPGLSPPGARTISYRGRDPPAKPGLGRGQAAVAARGIIPISDKQRGLFILRYDGPGKVTRA